MSVTTIKFPHVLPVTSTGATSWDLESDGVTQKVTNLTKPYWGPEGFTKGDLLAYYYNVAEWILPFLADRALTLKRMPDGADGDFFYAKNAPGHVPDWVPRAPIRAEGSGDVIDYLMAQDTASLVYVANLGCIEMHPWHSRIDALGYPDYAFFDLDPFGVDYRVVKDVALIVKAALDGLGLVGYPRTSGATGMHIYVPIDRIHTFAEVRDFITRVCRLINRADPERTTMAWQVADREGQVFLDAGMNTEGRNIASAYSVRPHRGATVSTPLTWEELESDVEPGDFTMASIWPRLAEVGDIFTRVLAGGQQLWPAMDAVGLDRERDRRGPSHTLLAEPPPAGVSPSDQDSETLRHTPRGTGSTAGGVSQNQRESSESRHTPDPAEIGELDTYASMRNFEVTAEPAASTPDPDADQSRFVIQHHLATRLHHDLRLERGGTLRSWALPKGLPLVPKLTHLAMQTEDHPLEYLTFSGDIPAGEYGGGQMRIWDTGTYSAVEWEDGKVTVKLDGIRHQGEWHLFRVTRRGPGGVPTGNPREWLITRSAADTQPLPRDPPTVKPCLATPGGEPFDDAEWLFEVKWDGVRVIATVTRPGRGPKESNNGTTVLRSRNGNDVTAAYPELWPLWERVLAFNAVLDGEVVALDAQGRPSFSKLQHRMHVRDRDRVEAARARSPVQLVVFDLLALDGELLTGLPLTDRLALLDEVFVPGTAMIRSEVVREHGTALFGAARTSGLEGVVAKRATSTYLAGRRSEDWRKLKIRRTADVVVGGWLESSSGNGDLGSLLVGAYRNNGLAYLGRVGTGFDQAERTRLMTALRETSVSPFSDAAAKPGEAVHWTTPDMVIEVEYAELTDNSHLRAPAYRHQRSDLDPAGIVTDVIA